MEYKVSWTIELNAESPEDAAFKALEMQRDGDSLATHFTVEDEYGGSVGIEIGEASFDISVLMDEAPLYVTVESHHGIVVYVNVYQSAESADEAEEEWKKNFDINDEISRECKEENGTSFQTFVTQIRP